MTKPARDLLPDFIIGGAGESGTSFLHQVLIQHPDIHLPRRMVPETGFFNKRQEYARGLDYYRTHFVGYTGQRLIGERTSGYLYVPESAARLHRCLPDIKLIFCLRDPVERAYSNYRFTCQQGLESWSFSRAIRQERRRLAALRDPRWQDAAPFAYVGRGMYHEQLSRFLEFFDRDRVLLVRSERLRDHWLEEIRGVFRFLGVDEHFVPQRAEEFNTSDVRSPRAQRLLRYWYGARFAGLIEESRRPARRSAALIRLNLKPSRSPMGADDRRYLEEVFAEPNRKLASLTGWNLSDWGTADTTVPLETKQAVCV